MAKAKDAPARAPNSAPRSAGSAGARAAALRSTDGAMVKAIRKAAEAEGASVKIVAPKVGGVTLQSGKLLMADGQLAGTPSVVFDAVAVVISPDGCAQLMGDSAAIDFVHNAFVHLKAIGFTAAAQPLLDKAGVVADPGIVDLRAGAEAFLPPARTRQWAREPSVRMLA